MSAPNQGLIEAMEDEDANQQAPQPVVENLDPSEDGLNNPAPMPEQDEDENAPLNLSAKSAKKEEQSVTAASKMAGELAVLY